MKKKDLFPSKIKEAVGIGGARLWTSNWRVKGNGIDRKGEREKGREKWPIRKREMWSRVGGFFFSRTNLGPKGQLKGKESFLSRL